MPTVVLPVTLAPAAGLVNDAASDVVGGGGGGGVLLVPFATVTVCVVVAVWPFAVTASERLRAPFATVLVSQMIHSVDPVAMDRVTIGAPSMDSTNVFGAPQVAVVAMPTDCPCSTR
jgi:hypothetical protein